jgi:WD40 repeat protein/tetratricopeptide (TPR) repeat protein
MGACPTSERLVQFLNGSLPEAEQETVAEHVDQCQTCQEALVHLGKQAGAALPRQLVQETDRDPGTDQPRRQQFLDKLKQNAPPQEEPSSARDSAGSLATTPGAPANPRAVLPPGEIAEAADAPAVSTSPPGYELLGELGRGGMGVVYKARQISLNRTVALKMIRAAGHASAADLARFRTEAEAIARLQHPHIVQVFEVGEHQGTPFFSLEFCPGGSLANRLTGTPLPPRQAAELVEVLARAMQAAHLAGIIHRDLKPGNILLGADGTPKITDFGLAKKLDEAGQTGSGALLGTPSYMAPEQARGRGKEIGPATDVYALGAILYECLTGRPPFQGPNSAEILLQVIADEPIAPRRLQPGVPRDLETICHKCLHKEPARRYTSARDLADDLRRFLEGVPIQARPSGPAERFGRWCRRHPARAGLVFALVLLGAAGGWAVRQSFLAETARAVAAEDSSKRSEAEAAAARERVERAKAESARLRAQTLPLLERAAGYRAAGFHQAAALYLARALPDNDDPRIRARWLEALQRSLVPVATSSRRVFTSTLTYSPDSRFLVSGGFLDGQIRVWRTDTWSPGLVLPAHSPIPGQSTARVKEIVFRPGRPNEIVSVGEDGTIQVWDLAAGTRLDRYPRGGAVPSAPLWTVAIEPAAGPGGGRRTVTGDEKGTLTWWRLDRLEKVKEVAAHARGVYRVRYRPDGRQCASTGADGVVRLWDAEGRQVGTLQLPDRLPQRRRERVQLLAAGTFSAAPLALSGGPIAVLPFLQAKTAELALARELYGLAYSPDGRQLAAGDQDGLIHVWDVAGQRLLHSLQGHEPAFQGRRWVVALSYTPACRLLSGGADGTIREWDTRSGRQVALRGRHDTNALGNRVCYTVAVRPDGREVASCGADYTIRIWQARTGKAVARLEGGPVRPGSSEHFPFALGTSAFCAGGHVLLTSNRLADACLRSWDTRTLRERRTYALPPGTSDYFSRRVSALAIHPDGSRFVSSEPNGDLIWWERERGKHLARSKAAHRPLGPREVADLVRRSADFQRRTGQIPSLGLLRYAEEGALSWLGVTALAWSQDGKWVASAGIDGTLKLWDAQGQRLLEAWKEEPPESPPGSGEQSPQGNLTRHLMALSGVTEVPRASLSFDAGGQLITAGGDRVIRLWKLGKGKPRVVARLRGHVRRVNALALSGDGKLLASGSEDGFVLLWDLEKRRMLRMTALAPLRSPDLQRFSAGLSEHGRASLVSAIKEGYAVVRSLAFSPEGRWLAVVLQDGSVSLLDADTGAVTFRGVGHETDTSGKSIVTAYFTRDGELVTVGGDETVRHWDLPAWSTGRRVLSPILGHFPVSRSWDPSGCVVRTTGGMVLHWSPRQGRMQVERNNHQSIAPGKFISDPAMALGCGRGDGKVVLANARGQVFVRDLTAGKTLVEFKGPPGAPRHFPAWWSERAVLHSAVWAWAGPRRTVADCGWALWLGSSATLFAPIEAVAVQPAGPLAASAWKDGSVDIWQAESGRWVRTLPAGRGRVTGLAFHPRDRRQLAVAYAGGELCLWDVEAGKLPCADLRGPANARGLCYSPDGKRLIQAGDDPYIAVWDPATGRRVRLLEGHQPAVLLGSGFKAAIIRGAAYSPDGKWLATGGGDGTIRLWDAKTFQSLAVLSVLTIKSGFETTARGLLPLRANPGIDSLTFTADGRQLVAVRMDSEVRVYDLEPIKKKLHKPAKTLLAETEVETGLRLQGDRLVPIPHIRLARAGETFRPTYERDYKEFLPRLAQANSLSGAGRPNEARVLLERLLDERGVPEVVVEMARTFLSSVYRQLGHLDRAEVEARKALAINPNNGLARMALAAAHLQQLRFTEALDVLRQSLAEPGLLPGAEKVLRRHLALTLAAQGMHLSQQRHFAQAGKQLREVSGDANLPVRGAVRRSLAWVYAEMGQLQKAQEELDRLSPAEKGLPDTVAFQAELDARRGKDLGQAEKTLRKLLEAQPNNPSYQATLGWVLAKRGRANEALALLEPLRGTPAAGNSVFLDQLGDVYDQAKMPAKAREAWRQALELFPRPADPDDWRKRALERKLKQAGL